MTAPVEAERGPAAGAGAARAFALLWLSGVSLRVTVLAVPPVIHLVRADWGLSGTEVGLLVTLPTALFAAAALPGAMLVSRLGPLRTLLGGLALTAVGAALRAAAPSLLPMLAATALMAAGVAVMQPTLPALVRRWSPARIGLATAVYSNGLLVGEIIPVALTSSLLPLLGGSWRAALAAWAVPVAATAALVAAAAPAVERRRHGVSGAEPAMLKSGTGGFARVDERIAPKAQPPGSALTWLLGVFFGCINATYFATNAFLPGLVTGRGRADLIAPTLTALNVGQLPAAFLLLGLAGRFTRLAWPFVAAGLLCLAAVAGIVSGWGAAVVASAALLGFSVAAGMILALTLPAVLYPIERVAASSAAMFTVSYAFAIAISLLGGAAWDVTGDARAPFAAVAACAAALAGFALLLRRRRHLR